jgi:hypothetical protein
VLVKDDGEHAPTSSMGSMTLADSRAPNRNAKISNQAHAGEPRLADANPKRHGRQDPLGWTEVRQLSF